VQRRAARFSAEQQRSGLGMAAPLLLATAFERHRLWQLLCAQTMTTLCSRMVFVQALMLQQWQ
jgi:hypothetical protein